MLKFFVNQKGIAPVILVIILSVVFAGAFGVVYQSRKEIKVRSDKTSEVTQLKDSPDPMSASTNTEAKTGQKFKLSSKPFEQKDSALPQFSFYPPDGWLKDKGTYTALFKDKISVGVAYLALAPSVNLAVVQRDLDSLEEVLAFVKTEVKKSSIDITSARKTKFNGTEGYLLEGKIKYGELSRKVLEEEIDKEIKNAQKKVIVSKDQIKKDIDEIVRKSDVKVIGYLFYKDGYIITVSGRALEEYWSQRNPQLKSSLDTFKFE
ncbi:hypothetical protein HYU93_03155 [Candidatus Daviesbacteria bacterium]|nr:hypothetical protein [Candidatus Daviesbacteria bacterium]